MRIGLFTEFCYPGNTERQACAEVLEQIARATCDSCERGMEEIPARQSRNQSSHRDFTTEARRSQSLE